MRDENGSVLLLVPAGILIVLALGAMTVNAAMAFQGERRAAAVAADVANDVATLGLDEEHFRLNGDYKLIDDLSSAAESAAAAAQAGNRGSFIDGTLQIDITRVAADTVRVDVVGQVNSLWNPPGSDGVTMVAATATATAAAE